MTPRPNPCCVPSKRRAQLLAISQAASAARRRAISGSTEDMVRLDGGRFLMGSDAAIGYPADGEGPVRTVTLDPFYIDSYPVTNRQFAEFVKATGYRTEAEQFGWSFVFAGHVKDGGPASTARTGAIPSPVPASTAGNLILWSTSPGMTRARTRIGRESACPLKPNGSTRREADSSRNYIPGAMN